MAKRTKKKSIHYVNNAEFSQAVVDYCKSVQDAKKKRLNQMPQDTDYIGTSFLKIAEGLSHANNFINYSYREEMVMDAVENCLKAIGNYNIEAATRTGKPNAFSYFTQISYYAFLRRIAKEKKQQDIKMKYIAQSGAEIYIDGNGDDNAALANFVDQLKSRIGKVKESDRELKEYGKALKNTGPAKRSDKETQE